MPAAPRAASASPSERDRPAPSGSVAVAAALGPAVIGCIVKSVDFERVLGSPIRARSTHFALHYLAGRPSRTAKAGGTPAEPKLSTGEAPQMGMAVDDCDSSGCWLGAVVPKRHARRSVTRSLLKRQIRQAATAQAGLANGLWVVRLRSPFDRVAFTSAASESLKRLAGQELAAVFADAVRRVRG